MMAIQAPTTIPSLDVSASLCTASTSYSSNSRNTGSRAPSTSTAVPPPLRRLQRSGSLSKTAVDTVRNLTSQIARPGLSSVNESSCGSHPRSKPHADLCDLDAMQDSQYSSATSSLSTANVTTRSRSHSTANVTGTGRKNFRPLAYQTHAQVNAFFGVTPAQKREMHLRSRDVDGRLWYDAVEREEWSHLLAPPSPSSPRPPSTPRHLSPMPRRRSSAWSYTLCSTTTALTESSTALTPTLAAFRFPGCQMESGMAARERERSTEGEETAAAPRRNRLKRSNSATALAQLVQDRLPPHGDVLDGPHWISVERYKRRASNSVSPDNTGTIHLAPLPLQRRKATKELLEEAFGRPRIDLQHEDGMQSEDGRSSMSGHNGVTRSRRPAPLALTSPATFADDRRRPSRRGSGRPRPYSSHGEVTPRTASSASSPLTSPHAKCHRRNSYTDKPSPPFSDLAYPSPDPSAPPSAFREVPPLEARSRRNTFGALVDPSATDASRGTSNTSMAPFSASSTHSSNCSEGVQELLASPLPVRDKDTATHPSMGRLVMDHAGFSASSTSLTLRDNPARAPSRLTVKSSHSSLRSDFSRRNADDDRGSASSHTQTLRTHSPDRLRTSTSSTKSSHTFHGPAPLDPPRPHAIHTHVSDPSATRSPRLRLRSAGSDSSLSSSSLGATWAGSNGRDGGGLTPRQAHRRQALKQPRSPSTSSLAPSELFLPPPPRDITIRTGPQPVAAEEAPRPRYTISTGLRTGLHVYDGVEIPCAAVHLASDCESSSSSFEDDEGGGFKKKGKKSRGVKRWFSKVVG